MRSLPVRATSVLAIAGALVLAGCDGVVDPEGQAPGSNLVPAGPDGAGSPSGSGPPGSGAGGLGTSGAGTTPGKGSAGSGNGGANGGSGVGPAAPSTGGFTVGGPPAPVAHAFTRLTRAEYLATTKAALGVDADATLVPLDGRTGPFTSNTGVSPDPVHPYLILAEDLAAAAIPSELPVCDASEAAACVRDDYAPVLEQLYRRPLADAELTALSRLVTDLAEQDVPALDATRAMLSSALISPDFLFRSAVAAEGEAANGRRLAERLSYALWDAPPDTALGAAAGSTAAGLAERLREQALRLTRDARAVPVLARFVGQWLHVDTDLRLEDPAFAASPRYRELVAFVGDAVAANVSVTSWVAGNFGFVHRDNLEAYGLSSFDGDDDVMKVTWPADSPRRGLLTQELFADATRHPDKSRRVIFRGKLVRSSLLCDTVPPPTPDLVAASAEVSDRTVEPRCAGCHLRMDPIGKAFAVLDADDPGGGGPAQINLHSELEGSYPDLPALLDAVATSRSFAECFAKNWLGFLLEVPLVDTDPNWVRELADAVQSGATLGDVVDQTVRVLESGSSSLEPMCQGP